MKKKSITMIIRNKLKETMDWYIPPQYIPNDKQLYYEAIRIRKAIKKYKKENQPSAKGTPTLIELGYRPNKDSLNSKKPPKGGSGLK